MYAIQWRFCGLFFLFLVLIVPLFAFSRNKSRRMLVALIFTRLSTFWFVPRIGRGFGCAPLSFFWYICARTQPHGLTVLD
ncbi:hypothetical protein J3E72DRAFT_296614, partial [Bipolaris maydis]|uniref:uncharacterized protein n=1 Tax=Cochliobolus heterostrophus TaxID=5016 RepID=UPI0024D2FF51